MNKTMMQYFEWYIPADGCLWKQLAQKAPDLAANGITSLWLPPAYKDANGMNGVGYAVYDLYDLGEFDQKGSVSTKYGTRDEYLKAIKSCQEAGISIYADIVLNHKTGADEIEEVDAFECGSNNREELTSGEEDIHAWTRFTFPNRQGKYSNFTWNATYFDGVDWDETKHKNSIYLLQGKNWEDDVDTENGNYDYLMGADIDFDQTDVIHELTRWGKWYYDTTKVDGFRLDAVKHIKSDFYRDWIPEMRKYAKKDLFVVGEYWHSDVNALQHYLDKTDQSLSLFDVPLHFNFYNASKNSDGYDLRNIFANSLVSSNPDHAVTFIDNHDTEPCQALSSYIEPWFRPLAYSLILLRESGYPCVFYGDYYGIPLQGIEPMGKELFNLISVRKSHAYGTQYDYFDDNHCIGFTREGLPENVNSGLACLLSSQSDTSKHMYVGQNHAGQKFFDVTFHCRQIVTIDSDGCSSFPVKAKSVSVWIPI